MAYRRKLRVRGGSNVREREDYDVGGNRVGQERRRKLRAERQASGITWVYVNDVPEGLLAVSASRNGNKFAEEVIPVRAGIGTTVHMLPLTAR